MQPLVYGALTPDDIRAVVHFQEVQGNPAGVGRVEAGLTVLDKDLNHVQTNIAPPKGVMADNDISSLFLTGSVSNDTTQAVQRALTLTMRQPTTFGFDPLQHLIQPRIRYWSNDAKTLLLDIPIGIFDIQWDKRDLNEEQIVWEMSGLDLTARMQKPFVNTWGVTSGYYFRQLALDLLMADEMPNDFAGGTGATPSGAIHTGPHYPTSRIQLGQNTQTTISALAFDWRDSQLDMLNQQVLAPINFGPLVATSTGQIVSNILPWFAQQTPQWEWEYVTDARSIFIPGTIAQSLEGWDKIGNIVHVVSENNQAAPIHVIKENTSLDSAISLPRYGRGKPVIVADDNIPDLDTANLRASLVLQRAHLLTDRIQFATYVNPFHESGDFYRILITDKYGTGQVQPGTYPYQGVAWAIDLQTLQMTHDVGKIVAIQ